MKTFSTKLGLAVGLLGWAVAPLQADFILTGSQYLEVTTTHNRGQMFDTSMALVHMGGRVYWLETFDWSSLGIGAGGYVDWLSTGGQSQTTIDGGAVWWLDAWQNSGVQLWNGPVAYAFLGDQARLDISGGSIDYAWISSLQAFGPVRLTMSNGSINHLSVAFILSGNDRVVWSGQISDLWPHGIRVQGGRIEELWGNFETSDTSRLDITGGLSGWIYATDSSTVNIVAGQTGLIDADEQSSISISGGIVGDPVTGWGSIRALGNSSIVRMTGGHVQYLYAEVWGYGPSRISITGGTLQMLGVVLTASDHQHVSYSGQLVDLTPHGIGTDPAYVQQWHLSIVALEQAVVEISGGDIGWIDAEGKSLIIISGGTIGGYPEHVPSAPRSGPAHAKPVSPDGIIAQGQAQVLIIDGHVIDLGLYEQACATVRGGYIGWMTVSNESQATLMGGVIEVLWAWDYSTVRFVGYDFLASEGLGIEGNLVLGTGRLSGKWSDGTPWQTWIDHHDPQAIIRTAACLLGDTNFDGVVDLADYNNIVNNLGATGFLGDTNGDGVVDLADYNNVVNNLGTSAPARLAVPEPASVVLTSLAGLLIRPRRKP